jgi:hypothetical protein
VLQFLVPVNVFHSALISFVLMMEKIISSETSVLPRHTRRLIPGDGTFRRHRRENLISHLAKELLNAYGRRHIQSGVAPSRVNSILHTNMLMTAMRRSEREAEVAKTDQVHGCREK